VLEGHGIRDDSNLQELLGLSGQYVYAALGYGTGHASGKACLQVLLEEPVIVFLRYKESGIPGKAVEVSFGKQVP